MQRSNVWLYRFAQLTVLATLVLIFLGGMVTSKGAGLAVPDWPTSFGYNMFTFPISQWTGGIFWEHVHRLVASGIGLLTTILAIWIWKSDPRPLVRWLGVIAFVVVCAQGIMGGLRVTKLSILLAMIHACTAQAFLCLLIVIAIFLSPKQIPQRESRSAFLPWSSWGLVVAVYLQLILGAVTRHMGAGLAIQDFPLAYGKIIPPFFSSQVVIHFSHRMGAVVVCVMVLMVAVSVFVQYAKSWRMLSAATWLVLLTSFQIALGAHIIWLMRPPVTTTLHVVNGAAILGISLLIAMRATLFKAPEAGERNAREPLLEAAT
jgi:heme a synthase